MHADLKYVESLEDEIDELESDKAEFSNIIAMIISHKVKECECLAQKLSKQTEFVSKEVYTELLRSFAKLEKHSISLELALQQCQEQMKNDTVCKEKASNVFLKEREQYFEIQDLKAQLQDKNIVKTTQNRAPQLPQTFRNTNPRVSTYTGVIHRNNVSRPQLRSTQMKDKVVPHNSHVKNKKTEVEDHHRISSISNKTKSVTACTDSLKSRTLNVNVVCATYGKYVFNSNHDACVYKYLNDVNARTKKPKVVPISTRKPKCQANKSVATHHKKIVASESTTQKSKSYYRIDLQGNNLLTGNRGSGLYIISLQETTSSTPICLMAKASPTQAWLWHQRLSHLNFDYINLLSKKDVVIGIPKLKYVKDQLCSSCEVSKAKRSSFKTKAVPSSKGWLNLLYMDLCGPMQVASINRKKYILVIMDDYLRYTWTIFLHSKDEIPEVLKDFLTMIQRNLQAPVISIRTDRGTEFLNKTLNAFFKQEGIEHQTFTPQTPEQNGIVERRNHTLVEAAQTMLSASKLPLFFWAEAITTACYTQNRSIIIPTHEKMAYHVINDRKPSIKHLHMHSDYDNSDLDPQLQNVSPSADTIVPSQQELDLLFGPLYDEFFNAGTLRINKSSSPTDNSIQKDILPLTNIHSKSEPSTPTNVYAEENNNDQAEFTNPFCTRVQEVTESSSHNIGDSNMHTFNQTQDSEYRWTKDHPLTQVRRNPSKPMQTRRQPILKCVCSHSP
ncbi:retrovirus-related pol polyprotein from transposon TNT 1-94 [Tanacetum coccineum]